MSSSRASANDASADLVFIMRRRKQEAALAAEFSQLAEERAQRQSDWDAVSNSSGAEAVSEATQMGRATKDAFAESEWRKVPLLHSIARHPRDPFAVKLHMVIQICGACECSCALPTPESAAAILLQNQTDRNTIYVRC